MNIGVQISLQETDLFSLTTLNHKIDQESKIVLTSSKIGGIEKGLTCKELWKWFTEYSVLGNKIDGQPKKILLNI